MNSKIIIVLIVLLFIALWDIGARLAWDINTVQPEQSNFSIKIAAPTKLSKKQQEALVNQYQTFIETPEIEAAPLQQGMGLENQLLQEGLLDQLYSGNLRIHLRAVVRQPTTGNSTPPTFALLSIENIKDGGLTLQKVQVSQQLYGYKVQTIQLNQITLVSIDDSRRVIRLAIYQKRTAVSTETESTLNRNSL